MHFIWPFYITAQKDQIESKIDSTLAKVEGLMAQSGMIGNRFEEIDNNHEKIKDEQSSLDEKVENIIDTIKELNSMLSPKEENEFLNQNATELS